MEMFFLRFLAVLNVHDLGVLLKITSLHHTNTLRKFGYILMDMRDNMCDHVEHYVQPV